MRNKDRDRARDIEGNILLGLAMSFWGFLIISRPIQILPICLERYAAFVALWSCTIMDGGFLNLFMIQVSILISHTVVPQRGQHFHITHFHL